MKRYHEALDCEWMRTSIVATSVINQNLKKADRLKLDHFVPKRSRSGQGEAKRPTSDARAVLERIKYVQSQIDAGLVKFPKAKP